MFKLYNTRFIGLCSAEPYKLYIIKTHNQDLDIGYFNDKEWVTEFGHIDINNNGFEIAPLKIYESLLNESNYKKDIK